MKQFSDWLSDRKVSNDAIQLLLVLLKKPNIFETAEKIMEPDSWFHYPNNQRFVLLGSCPNGDGIGLDTAEKPGAIFFICHERIQDDLPDSDKMICIADTLELYLQH